MGEDEEDPEEDTGPGDEEPESMKTVTFNKKTDAFQMQPITLLDSAAGIESLFNKASMSEGTSGN